MIAAVEMAVHGGNQWAPKKQKKKKNNGRPWNLHDFTREV